MEKFPFPEELTLRIESQIFKTTLIYIFYFIKNLKLGQSKNTYKPSENIPETLSVT